MELLNIIHCGDNLGFMRELPENFIDLIYIDPQFYSDTDYGDFDDRWKNISEYLEFMIPRLKEIYRILKPTGSFYLHCDWHSNHYLKIELDKIFGYQMFRNQIYWTRNFGHHLSKHLDNIMDLILFYTKSDKFFFNPQHRELSEREIERQYPYIEKKTKKRFRTEPLESSTNAYNKNEVRNYQNREYHTQLGWKWTQSTLDKRIAEHPNIIYLTKNNKLRYKVYYDNRKQKINNLWNDIFMIQNKQYKTQKPEALLERIILQSSKEGDIIGDFWCGSGTTCIVAKKHNRRWIGCDINPEAINITNKRLEHSKIKKEYRLKAKNIIKSTTQQTLF